ncbi:MAG: hypothetical protein LQ351_004125 [Letrouitia transgressa]|nr:MAG: hypothetical protein LQ351_004125 [Letrouitia transgressa]
MVSELVPACPDFRRRLNATREKQRRERKWIFKAIEIATATTFLLDQFLKTRAGENVLALMTAVAPLISQDACSLLLNHLFDQEAISADHTPGFGQFSKLRDGLIDFTRQAGFRENVLHYHGFLARRFEIDSDPYEAIPSVEGLSHIIKLCHKIVSMEDDCILRLKGLKGAGWIAAYTGQILGLPVCAVDQQGNQHPMTNNYLNAKVIIEPFGNETKFEVLTVGGPSILSDLIQIGSLASAQRQGWSVSCSEVNYLLYRHPELCDDLNLSTIISDFVARLSLTTLFYGATAHLDFERHGSGLRPYSVFVLRQTQERCLEILETLGFTMQRLENYQENKDFERCLNRYAYELLPSPSSPLSESKHFKHILGKYKPRVLNSKILRHSLTYYLDQCEDNKFKELFYKDNHLFETVVGSVLLAITLAFSDWNLGLRSLSSKLFSRASNAIPDENIAIGVSGIRYLIRMILLFSGVLNDVEDVERYLPDTSLVAEIDNLVILENSVLHTPLMKTKGHLWCLSYGHLHFDGGKR